MICEVLKVNKRWEDQTKQKKKKNMRITAMKKNFKKKYPIF